MKVAKIIVLILCLAFALQTNADDWDKEAKNAFRKAKVVEVNVDMTKTTFAGLDSLSFVEYMAEKENHSVAYVSKYFHFFRLKMMGKMNSMSKKDGFSKEYTLKPNAAAEYRLDVTLEEVTENAGMTGSVCVYPKGNKTKASSYEFTYKDGRWNSFEKLFYEAAETLGKDIVRELQGTSTIYSEDVARIQNTFKKKTNNLKKSVKKATDKFVESVKEKNPFSKD